MKVEQIVLEWQRSARASRKLFDDKRLIKQAMARSARRFLVGELIIRIDKPLHHIIGQTLVFAPLRHMIGVKTSVPKARNEATSFFCSEDKLKSMGLSPLTTVQNRLTITLLNNIPATAKSPAGQYSQFDQRICTQNLPKMSHILPLLTAISLSTGNI
ncbi:MAG: hypothetical protein V8T51_02915 [Senegalimassilia faecalis]